MSLALRAGLQQAAYLAAQVVMVPQLRSAEFKLLAVRSPQDGLAQLAQACAQWPWYARLNIWLSGEMCKPFLLPEAAEVAELADRASLAKHFAAARTGTAVPCVAVVDGARAASNLAAAVPQDLLNALALHPTLLRRTRTLAPYWSACLNEWLGQGQARGALLGVAEEGCLTLLGGTQGQFSVAASRPAEPDAEQLTALWQRSQVEHLPQGQVAKLVRFSPAAHAPSGSCRLGNSALWMSDAS